jgi:hypothetical protein
MGTRSLTLLVDLPSFTDPFRVLSNSSSIGNRSLTRLVHLSSFHGSISCPSQRLFYRYSFTDPSRPLTCLVHLPSFSDPFHWPFSSTFLPFTDPFFALSNGSSIGTRSLTRLVLLASFSDPFHALAKGDFIGIRSPIGHVLFHTFV